MKIFQVTVQPRFSCESSIAELAAEALPIWVLFALLLVLSFVSPRFVEFEAEIAVEILDVAFAVREFYLSLI